MPDRKVVVFAKPDDFIPKCQPCIATKRWLDDRDVEHKVEDATQPWALEYIKSNSKESSAPVVFVIEDESIVDVWSGFRPDKLDTLLTAS